MRRITQFALMAFAVLFVLTSAGTASAGEPFHPIWIPESFFFYYFGWF
jgi:hypothetical protein